MKIGIMTVNGFDFHPNQRLGEAAADLGHRVELINPYEMGCLLVQNRPKAFIKSIDVLPDLVLPRQGSPMGEYGFVLLAQFAALGIPLVNDLEGVRIARNQFLTLQHLASAGLPVPDSCFVVSQENFFVAVQRLGGYPVVAKQVDGMGGDGVVRIDDDPGAKAFLEAAFFPKKGVLVQAYLPPETRTDLRLLVIGSQVAGAMALTPAKGSFKSNIHQMGTAKPYDPPAPIAQMGIRAARACGLSVAGVDLMMDKGGRALVSEVNYSPGFRGLEAATGLNIAEKILTHALGFVKGGAQ